MTIGGATSITPAAIRRQPTEPSRTFDGLLWIDNSGNNTERNYWNNDTGTWELSIATGPDTPEYPVDGSLWSDTGDGETKRYDAGNARWETTQYTKRQTTEPTPQLDGMTWIDPSAGANGNNTEYYTYNASAGTWELYQAIGPDTPSYEVDGSLWSDTGSGTAKRYDAGSASWKSIGVTDHANLSNVQPDQHHAPPSSGEKALWYGSI